MTTQLKKHSSRLSPVLLGASSLALALALSGCTVGENPAQTLPSPEETTTPPTATPTTPPTDDPSDAETIRYDERRVISSADPVSFHCDGGGEIEIRVDGAQLTATGNCEEIDIHGSNVTVSAENSDEVEIHGSSNVVTAMTIKELEVDGNQNQITSDNITEEIEVEGTDNTVNYAAGDPRTENEGSGNTINRG